jgi:malonyl-CoA O-methyltransferase
MSASYRQVAKKLLGPRLVASIRGVEEQWRLTARRRRIGDRSTLPYERALEWVKRYSLPQGGISQTSGRPAAYPEVTAYFIPTLLELGERGMALRHAGWLAAQARADGSIPGPDGRPYTFDTSQALRGLLAAYRDDPSLEPAVIATAEFLCSQIGRDGVIDPCTRDHYVWSNGRRLGSGYLLYVLPPLLDASRVFGRVDWKHAAERALAAARSDPALLDADQLSHFYAYVIEALVDLGETEHALPATRALFRSLRSDGSLPAYPGASWTCSAGNIQFALIAYKLGLRREAEQLYRWAERAQEASGGFRGSYGRGAAYSRDEEVSWAVKFFLDATLWRVKTGFNSEAAFHPDAVAADDPRLSMLLAALGPLEGRRVLDLGCGKGRFAAQLMTRHPRCALMGIDTSEEMLRSVAGAFPTRVGSILHLPFAPGSFDAAYAVESFEHVLNPLGALREVHRCLTPGGCFVIIDKHLDSLGTLDVVPWEKWFNPGDLAALAEWVGFQSVRCDEFWLDGAASVSAPRFFGCAFRKP